jgi:uncharacterized protein (TIGR02246 family)
MNTRQVVAACVVALGILYLTKTAVDAQSPGDEAVIRAQVERLVALYNAKDPAGIALLYAPDADRRDGSGTWARGRKELTEMYERAIRSIPTGVTVRFDFTVRFVTPTVALVDGLWFVSTGTRGPFTVVVSKQSGRWLVVAGRQGAAFSQ